MGKMDTMGEKKYSYHAISRAYRTRTMPLFRFSVPGGIPLGMGKPTPSSVYPREGEIRTPGATSLSATKYHGSGLQVANFFLASLVALFAATICRIRQIVAANYNGKIHPLK